MKIRKKEKIQPSISIIVTLICLKIRTHGLDSCGLGEDNY